MHKIAPFKTTFSKKLLLLGGTSPLRHPPASRKRDGRRLRAIFNFQNLAPPLWKPFRRLWCTSIMIHWYAADWMNLDPLHSPLGCRCMIMNTSGTALHYKWPVVFSAAAFDSKFISFIVRKQRLASLQPSCWLVGTSIRCKQNTTLNPGLSI